MTGGPVRVVSEFYPQFKRIGPPPDGTEAWEGVVQPLAGCGASDLALLLDDLHAGAAVLASAGRLEHDPACRREHKMPSYLSQLRGINEESFAIRVVVWPAPRHPKAFALYPEISAARFPHHPHLFRHREPPGVGERLPDALCTYRPGDGEWSWASADLVTFLDYVAIYLAKHVVWTRTGANERAVWIGPHASHLKQDVIQELNHAGECHCGSGRRYSDCCLPEDRIQAAISATTIAGCRQALRRNALAAPNIQRTPSAAAIA